MPRIDQPTDSVSTTRYHARTPTPNSARWSRIGAGEWVFALPSVRVASKARDQRYLEHCKKSGMPKRLVGKLRRLRELAPAFLEHCADEILAAEPAVVGFTATFSQTLPSMALAQARPPGEEAPA